MRTPELLAFLKVLLEQLAGPTIVLWDRLQVHRAKKVRAFVAANKSLRTVHPPPYAPELNPVEHLWPYLKLNPLANLACISSLCCSDALTSTGSGSSKRISSGGSHRPPPPLLYSQQ